MRRRIRLKSLDLGPPGRESVTATPLRSLMTPSGRIITPGTKKRPMNSLYFRGLRRDLGLGLGPAPLDTAPALAPPPPPPAVDTAPRLTPS